jgi:hypothetical protein
VQYDKSRIMGLGGGVAEQPMASVMD